MNEREKKAVERIEDTFYSDLGKGINKFQKIKLYEDGIRDVRILLNLLEKLQKENEILKEEKEQAWEEWNNLEQGSCETEQKLKQQIKKLQKENEELKRLIAHKNGYTKKLEEDLFENAENYVIPIQKVKDKISERRFELQQEYKDFEDDAILIVLQELIEGRSRE